MLRVPGATTPAAPGPCPESVPYPGVMRHLLLCTTLVAIGCSGGGGDSEPPTSPGTGTLSLEVTDAPLTHDLVTEASIEVDLVRIHGEDAGWRDLEVAEHPLQFDLLELQNGVTRLLTSATELPAGTYDQLRLRVASARLVLVDGDVFTTDDGTLQLTSQDTSGFKLPITPPLVVEADHDEHFLVDVDLSKTFKPVPANDPLDASKFLLHPVIHVSNLEETGEITGRVVDGNLIGLEAATVYALPPGSTDPEASLSSTGTVQDGDFTLQGLSPGTYDLLGVFGDLSGTLTGVEVSATAATEVEIELK